MTGTTTMTLHRVDGERRTHTRDGDQTVTLTNLANRFAFNLDMHRVTVTRDVGPVSVLVHDTRPMGPVTRARQKIEVFAAGLSAWCAKDRDELERLGAALRVASAWEEGPMASCYPPMRVRARAVRTLLSFLWTTPDLTRAIMRVVSALV